MQETSWQERKTLLLVDDKTWSLLHDRRSVQRLLYATTSYCWLYVVHVSQTGYKNNVLAQSNPNNDAQTTVAQWLVKHVVLRFSCERGLAGYKTKITFKTETKTPGLKTKSRPRKLPTGFKTKKRQ